MSNAKRTDPLTGAERQTRFRDGQKLQNRRKVEFWLTDDESSELKRLLNQLRRCRE